MFENGYWRNRDMRNHVKIIDGLAAPTLVLQKATYLNVFLKQWLTANIWIDKERIVYVGDELPKQDNGTTYVDCEGKYLVPGYIEPHAHPFQLYNPEQLAYHAAASGTTTLVNDNLMWHFLLDKKKAFTLLDEFDKLPISMYWWARFDSQTTLKDEDAYFNTKDVLNWLSHPSVVQGGELTAWPQLLDGDDRLLYWIQEANRLNKPVEGHFPGASEKTLTKLKLLGVHADHESMTGKDVITRLRLGYQVGLRHSSIRPDLPHILEEIIEANITSFDQITMTTDGATPSFYERGLMNVCLEIAIEKGVPLEEAYCMVTYNVAKHLRLEDQIGSIAPGRIAHINILEAKNRPTPIGVLAKGKWIVKDGINTKQESRMNWTEHGVAPLQLNWDLTMEDLQFSTPIGLKMVNDVIMKPYPIQTDITLMRLPDYNEEAFLMLVDRYGKWHVNTLIHGFTHSLGAIASSYSNTGDIVLIGKNKQDILLAGKRLKEIQGGIVIVHEGEVLLEIPLHIGGVMYEGEMDTLIKLEKELQSILTKFGYPFADPVYTILFLSSTHLPYIRITQKGIVDVMSREVMFPATMR